MLIRLTLHDTLPASHAIMRISPRAGTSLKANIELNRKRMADNKSISSFPTTKLTWNASALHALLSSDCTGLGVHCQRTKDDNDNFSKVDLEQEIASIELSVWASFNPEAPTEGFHFADHKIISTLELEEYVKRLLQRGQPEWLVEALKRGFKHGFVYTTY